MPRSSSTSLLLQSAWRYLPFGLVGAACSAYQSPTGFCTAPRSIAIEVAVTDSVSGQPLAAGTSGQVQAGAYADSLVRADTSSLLLLGGTRLGTYTVTVIRPSYQTWVRAGVLVTETGICGNVVPVELEARLKAVP